MGSYLLRRGLIFIPQLIGVTFIVFFLIRLLPGDPAVRLAGAFATEENIERVRHELNLDQGILEQYWGYLKRIAHGDLGDSTFTSNPVLTDLANRLPATFELVGLSLLIGLALAIPLGVYTALSPRGAASRGVFGYGMLSGALPDFWLGLLLIWFFFTLLGIAPAPVGQLDIGMAPPPRVTGMYVVDAALAGDSAKLWSAITHLVLPVATLVFVYFGLVLKMTRAAMDEVLQSPWMRFAIASGVSRRTMMRYGLRNALPPVLTVTGVVFLFLIGGAVLVETVFSWGGLGQYAVQAIQASDYMAIQGFVLVAALFSLAINLLIDVLYSVIDPRVRVAAR